MEFVPLESFEFLNSLLQGVEAQGCLMTVRLEAFTCRCTRKKKLLAASIAEYANKTTPPLRPLCSANAPVPPLLNLSDDSVHVVPTEPVEPSDIDDRLVFLVAALNSIYGEDGYDFSVLTEEDFVPCDEAHVRAEVNNTLRSFPSSCGPAVGQFWVRVTEHASDASQGCEYFRFASPSCDPMASRALFSQHYFLYNKRTRLLVSLLIFAEGNLYRGDDGTMIENSLYYETDDNSNHQRPWLSSPDGASEDDEQVLVGKNVHYYYRP
ncbi:hypothetical protein, conserved [Trypanosoma brucei brucei TREU927]|uniref:Maf1 regulator n=2 Tax=Trypanosoma brucei TaxID=5691 RepID=Q57YV3_TRYB2|nr:hypothetical protein, conserved [Trypanosoma brucei brucei TREU927]AAX69237.1 hypothetical protein, conserved [Trypanosoma brucei]AAZ13488.1 hypothetical protein, conserved [Trypanosoma brucei brucei TREU927]RHW73037.1 Maf1 regulator [Trypanosoma brucei equiperdum]